MRASMEGYVEIVKLLQADPEIDIALRNKVQISREFQTIFVLDLCILPLSFRQVKQRVI